MQIGELFRTSEIFIPCYIGKLIKVLDIDSFSLQNEHQTSAEMFHSCSIYLLTSLGCQFDTLFFYQNYFIKEHRGAKSAKIKNKLRTITASESITR